MEYRPLEITIVSAKGLKKVKDVKSMDVYIETAISGNPNNVQRTPAAKEGGTSPTWNFQVQFLVNEVSARQNGLHVVFRVKCVRPKDGDTDLGEAKVPLKDLLDKAGKDSSSKEESCPVKKPSGKEKGELKFTFKFGGVVVGGGHMPPPPLPHPHATNYMPPTAYPLTGAPSVPYAMPVSNQPTPRDFNAMPQPPHLLATSYNVQPALGAYTPPPLQAAPPACYPPAGYPQPGYGYGPPGGYGAATGPGYGGYGYAPPVQSSQQAGGVDGLSTGAALVGGMIGGVLLTDMVTNNNAGSAYEAGYDAGFTDAKTY